MKKYDFSLKDDRRAFLRLRKYAQVVDPDYLIPGPAIQFVTIVRFPRIFSDDHMSRDLPTGQGIRESQTTMTWACNDAELSEWRSDANHYSDCDRAGSGWGEPSEHKALGRGARRIVEIIDDLGASTTC